MHSSFYTEQGRFIPSLFLFLCGSLLVLTFISPLVPLAYLALAVHAVRGPRQIVQSLALLSLLLLLNPDLVSSDGKMLRWLVLFAAFGQVVWDTLFRNAPSPRKLLTPLFSFIAVAVVLALLSSYAPAISVLKAVAFTTGTVTILVAFHRTRHLQHYWAAWFTTFFLFILFSSLPLYFTGAGFARTGSLFQGILNHPQAFGPIAASAAVWLTSRYLFHFDRSRVAKFGMALAWFGVYSTSSRTALLVVVGSLVLTIGAGYVRGRFWRPDFSGIVSATGVLLAVLMSATLLVWKGAQVQESAVRFLLKDEGEATYAEAFQSSRGFLIDQQLSNFASAPITGIGFGVPSDPAELEVKTAGPLNLPVGASVEKGFMPSAVLEELGITGAIFVILLLVALLRAVYARGAPPACALLLACLLVNLGEMVFLSVGGMGLYFWVLIGLSYNLSQPVGHFEHEPALARAENGSISMHQFAPRRYRRVANQALVYKR